MAEYENGSSGQPTSPAVTPDILSSVSQKSEADDAKGSEAASTVTSSSARQALVRMQKGNYMRLLVSKLP